MLPGFSPGRAQVGMSFVSAGLAQSAGHSDVTISTPAGVGERETTRRVHEPAPLLERVDEHPAPWCQALKRRMCETGHTPICSCTPLIERSHDSFLRLQTA